MTYHMNILIKSTAGEPPWSNGITERNNVILRNMKSNLMLDKSSGYPMNAIVAWALKVKNTLDNY